MRHTPSSHDPIVYTADSHLDHKNVIEYARRPFADVDVMNDAIRRALIDAHASGARIIHAGDLSFDFRRYVARNGPLWTDRRQHTIVFGNHDSITKPGAKLDAYTAHFQMVSGAPHTWRTNSHVVADTVAGRRVFVLVSHCPQRELCGCDYNVFGHVHNNLLTQPEQEEDAWAARSPVHLCASVELHGYAPVSLAALIAARLNNYSDERARLARRIWQEMHNRRVGRPQQVPQSVHDVDDARDTAALATLDRLASYE